VRIETGLAPPEEIAERILDGINNWTSETR